MESATPDLRRVDLKAAMAEGEALIDAALAAHHTERLRAELAPMVAAAGPAAQDLAEGLIAAIGALSARVALLQQAATNVQASRAALIAIDPLPFIPEDRTPLPVQPPPRYALAADAPDFNGTGFYGPETNGRESWRWVRPDSASTILLPSLGGGRLLLRVGLMLPFGHTFDTAVARMRVNSMDVEMAPVIPPGNRGLFEATIELPEDEGLGTFVLMLESTSFTVPDAVPNSETRALGLGLQTVVLEKLVAGPALALRP